MSLFDQLLVLGILFCIVVLAVPGYLFKPGGKPLACVETMVEIARGEAPEDPACPVEDCAYARDEIGDVERVACARGETHLFFGLQVEGEGGSIRFAPAAILPSCSKAERSTSSNCAP